MSKMDIAALLERGLGECPCGRSHKTDLRWVRVGEDALAALPEMLEALYARRPMLVCDQNTWDAAGARAAAILDGAGIPYGLYRFETRARLNPAEWELGSLAMRFDPACDLILGVGGGVINDLCKMLGKAASRPTAIVGTAPSMDGFASNSGAMEVGGIKKTIYTPAPAAVLLDTGVLAKSRKWMRLAGVGDMIAKYVSICEWRISHLINGEYYCERVADMMREALSGVMENLEGVVCGDPAACGAVGDGLVRAGMAMAYAQVSRPASGLEHCFSHIWEMMALERGRPYELHGIQVGVGTMLTLRNYKKVRALRPTMARVEAAIAAFDQQAWEANLRRVFGSAAEALIEQEKTQRKNDPEGRRRRAEKIIGHWDEILRIIDEELPRYEALRARMEAIGLPMRPEDIGISKQDALDAFVCSRDIRDRYLSTSMLWDAGLLDECADYMKTEVLT